MTYYLVEKLLLTGSSLSYHSLSRAWDVFSTIIFNSDRILSFDELLARCTEEETRMMERDKPSNGSELTTFPLMLRG